MSESSDRYVKVLFEVPNEDGSADVETLWAIDLGADQCRLDNSPFYAYSVSWQDIVHAPFDAEQGFRTFQKVVSKSGNRTVRVMFDAPLEAGNRADQVLKELVSLGCSYEGAGKKYFSINLPPEVDLQKIRAYLVTSGTTWEHADPTYAELFPGDDI
ncbi:MAG TPA: DUF4265 domain-containing protein [Dongiaceae bacterium]|jgi:hypothetical protein